MPFFVKQKQLNFFYLYKYFTSEKRKKKKTLEGGAQAKIGEDAEGKRRVFRKYNS